MSLLTCKDLLEGLNDYLDETADESLRSHIEEHLTECPNCWVIVDTTKKTLKVYKGMDVQPLPPGVGERLMEVIEKKMADDDPKTPKSS